MLKQPVLKIIQFTFLLAMLGFFQSCEDEPVEPFDDQCIDIVVILNYTDHIAILRANFLSFFSMCLIETVLCRRFFYIFIKKKQKGKSKVHIFI